MRYLSIIAGLIMILFSSFGLHAEQVQKINPDKKAVLGIKNTVHFSWYKLVGIQAYEVLIHKLDGNNQWRAPNIKWIHQQNNTSVISTSIKLAEPENGSTYAWNVRGYKRDSSGKLQADNTSQYNIFTLCPPTDPKSSDTKRTLQEFKIIVDTKLTSYISKKIKQLSNNKPIPEIMIKKCRKISSQLSLWSKKAGQALKKYKGKKLPSKIKNKYIDELLSMIKQILLK